MTGIKGQKWKKEKMIKFKKGIQLTNNENDFVKTVAKNKEWSESKVIHKIFAAGLKNYKC